MAQGRSKKVAGGLYVCSGCEETFSSIIELRVHEKLCREGDSRSELGPARPEGSHHSRESNLALRTN